MYILIMYWYCIKAVSLYSKGWTVKEALGYRNLSYGMHRSTVGNI